MAPSSSLASEHRGALSSEIDPPSGHSILLTFLREGLGDLFYLFIFVFVLRRFLYRKRGNDNFRPLCAAPPGPRLT